ncbi:MAG: hypothetical protein J6Y89_01590 [Lachnospiraceae bacterium]|nr:hypothetical protein [Lachnospiraceae bacterium]
MGMMKKPVCLLLATVLVLSTFTSLPVNAKVSQPAIKLKKINDGTGVKIVITKTKGAEGYFVYMTKRKDAYKNYLSRKGTEQVELANIKKSGKKDREYVINGLPEGKYTFMVEAYMLDSNGYPEPNKSKFSEQKTVKIKAAKASGNASGSGDAGTQEDGPDDGTQEDTATSGKKYDFSAMKTGDTIEFGAYEQNDLMNDGKEAIEWTVLGKTEDRLLLISKYVLDVLPYNRKSESTSWEKSSLRKWLNGYFYDTAFTDTEKAMILPTELKDLANAFYDHSVPGNDTVDNVFLFSLDDLAVEQYTSIDEADIMRRCAATPYARALGLWTVDRSDDPDWNHNKWSKYATQEYEPSCDWWLRTTGYADTEAVCVLYDGSVLTGGRQATLSAGVRPVIYVKLKEQ